MKTYERVIMNNTREWMDIRAAVLAGEELDGRWYMDIGTRAGEPNGFLVKIDESGRILLSKYGARHVRRGDGHSTPHGSWKRVLAFPADAAERAALIGPPTEIAWAEACARLEQQLLA